MVAPVPRSASSVTAARTMAAGMATMARSGSLGQGGNRRTDRDAEDLRGLGVYRPEYALIAVLKDGLEHPAAGFQGVAAGADDRDAPRPEKALMDAFASSFGGNGLVFAGGHVVLPLPIKAYGPQETPGNCRPRPGRG